MSMSTTTDILFNSPALHSLKRDQLVKLCKIHSIKASGKNVELIEKLKKHAETLPKDSPLSVAARSEDPFSGCDQADVETVDDVKQTTKAHSQSPDSHWSPQVSRPSEQWEVIMESIEEADEQPPKSPGIPGGDSGEFGTDRSKSSNVSSSIKALAGSLGLKRDNALKLASTSSQPVSLSHSSKEELMGRSDNLSSSDPSTLHCPMPDIEDYQNPEHLPGHSLRPGQPAPDNARLSFGLNQPATPTRNEPTTTIRLIPSQVQNDQPYGRTPQLKSFNPAFELDFGSPDPSTGRFRGVPQWPMSPDKGRGVYPPLPLEDLVSLSKVPDMAASPEKSSVCIYPTVPSSLFSAAPTTTSQLSDPEPFIFGSPLPQHNVSNEQFKSAATSVLEEMNKRLKQEGVEGVGVDLLSKLQPGSTREHGKGSLLPLEEKDAPKTIAERFDEIHTHEFNKMEGIDSLVKRRGIRVREKRKSSMGVGRDRFGRRVGGEGGRISAARVFSGGKSPRVIPGGFGDDVTDDEEDAAEQPTEDVRATSSAMNVDKEEGQPKAAEEEQKHKEKEKEVVRKKLEINKARRKSGVAGRVSVGRDGVLHKPQPTPKSSRFGFLSSARSLVRKVWGGGKNATKTPTSNTNGIPKLVYKPSTEPVPPSISKKGPIVVNPSTVNASSSSGRTPSLRTDKTPSSSITFSNSRSPLPFSSSTASSLARHVHSDSLMQNGTFFKKGLVSSSSLGTRSSLTSTTSSNRLSSLGSMGSKLPITGRASASAAITTSSSSRSSSSSSSRLLAPTVSSLAKTTRPLALRSKSNLKNTTTGHHQKTLNEALEMITNRPGTTTSELRSGGGIFSEPLTVPKSLSSSIPVPTEKRAELLPSAGQNKDAKNVQTPATPLLRQQQRSIITTGRKPRISRSKVIAKLAEQRAASAVALNTPSSSSRGTTAGRMRSSLGAKMQYRSGFGARVGGGTPGGASADGVLMSAKKRARQSEYARRRSRVASIDFGTTGSEMDVDAK